MLFNTSNFIISQYLTNTSITLVTLILGITIYHTVSKGINNHIQNKYNIYNNNTILTNSRNNRNNPRNKTR